MHGHYVYDPQANAKADAALLAATKVMEQGFTSAGAAALAQAQVNAILGAAPAAIELLGVQSVGHAISTQLLSEQLQRTHDSFKQRIVNEVAEAISRTAPFVPATPNSFEYWRRTRPPRHLRSKTPNASLEYWRRGVSQGSFMTAA